MSVPLILIIEEERRRREAHREEGLRIQIDRPLRAPLYGDEADSDDVTIFRIEREEERERDAVHIPIFEL